MSFGNRLLSAAARGCLVASLLLLPWAAIGQQHPQPPKATATTQTQQQAAPPPLTDSALRAIFDEAVKKYAEEKAANEPTENRRESREASDLFAQWQQSRWGKWSAIFAGIGLFANATAIGLIWLTFRETRRTAGAAVDQAEAANTANRHSLVNAQHELRAYVFMKEVVIQLHKGPGRMSANGWDEGPVHTFRIIANVGNSGSTPTRHLRAAINRTLRDSELPADFDYPDGEIGPHVIGPNANMHLDDTPFSMAEIASVADGAKRAYVWAWIDYNDIFDDTPRHRTEFCFEVRAVRDPTIPSIINLTFITRGPFNAFDSDCIRQPKPHKE